VDKELASQQLLDRQLLDSQLFEGEDQLGLSGPVLPQIPLTVAGELVN